MNKQKLIQSFFFIVFIFHVNCGEENQNPQQVHPPMTPTWNPHFFSAQSKNSSSPSFLVHSSFPGDFNGDGKKDIVLVSSSLELQFLYGSGASSFETLSKTSPTTTSVRKGFVVAVSDFNQDGYTDLLVAPDTTMKTPFSLETWVNQKNGSFFAKSVHIQFDAFQSNVPFVDKNLVRVMDINQDGYSDILWVVQTDIDAETSKSFGQLHVLLGNKEGSFTNKISPTALPSRITDWELADMNQDGILDFIFSYQSLQHSESNLFQEEGIYVCMGQSLLQFSSPILLQKAEVDQVVIQDLNHDGKADILYTNLHSFGYLLNQISQQTGPMGSHSFQSFPLKKIQENEWLSDIKAADINQDGKMDIVFSTTKDAMLTPIAPSSTLHIFLGQEQGLPTEEVRFPASTSVNQIQVFDINGDTIPEIITTHVFVSREEKVLLGGITLWSKK